MELKKGLEIIIRDLKEAIDIIEDISRSHNVPAFQSELAKTKCRSAVDLLSMLAESGIDNPIVEKPAKVEMNTEAPLIADEQEAILFLNEEEEPEMHAEEEKETVPDAGTIEDRAATEPAAEKTPAEAPAEKAPKRPETDKQIMADKFGNGPATVADKIPGIKSEKDLSSKIKSQPVTDINDAIGLNDKFFFIRELFGGNGQLFSDVVKELNGTGSMDEARKVLKNSAAGGYNNDAMNLFIDIVARKLKGNG